MRYQVLCIGKAREPFYRAAAQEYLTRLSRYGTVIVRETAKEATAAPADLERAYDAVRGDHVKADFGVALDCGGKAMTSDQFAQWLGGLSAKGLSLVSFVIGGPHGLARRALADSDLVLSLSAMTLPHQLARVLLLEQIYRGLSMLKGDPYAK